MARGSGREAGAPCQAPGRARRGRVAIGCAAALALTAWGPSAAVAAPAEVVAKLRAVKAPRSELRQTRAVTLPGGATVYRFGQQVEGLRVLDGEAVVIEGPGGAPELVGDATRAGIDPPPRARISERQAIGIAARSGGVRRLRGPSSAALAIEPGDGGTLAWRVAIPSARPLADLEVLVSAVSGDVLSSRDLLRSFRIGRAKLYNPNPVVEHGGFGGLRSDNHDRDTRLLTSLRRLALLTKVRSGQDCLRGKWAHAKLGRDAHEVCRRSLKWKRATRSKDRFEALMTYFHITRAQRYIHRLGFSDPANGINDRSQVTIADSLAQDNSFYSPLTRRIEYGAGGVDDAEDADVILHEYGHALQDDQRPGFGDCSNCEAGAIGEGFGDYWAAAMSSRSPGTGKEDDVCIFDWDATTYGAFSPLDGRFCGRRADDEQTFDAAESSCGSQIHCWGQAWSSALLDIRTAVGVDPRTFDRLLLGSQFAYMNNERFTQAARALLDVDATTNGGSYHAAICAEMETGRGLALSACP